MVLLANLLGALAFALVAARTSSFDPQLQSTFVALGREALDHDAGVVALRAVFAGWLIALMVWLLPLAESARVWVIVIVTYLVGVSEFPHVIAGTVETFTAAAAGEADWGPVVLRWLLPTLGGNIVGGVTVVAMLNHAQVTAGKEGEDI